MKTKLIILSIILVIIGCESKKNSPQIEYPVDSSVLEIKKGDTIITFDSLGNNQDTIVFI